MPEKYIGDFLIKLNMLKFGLALLNLKLNKIKKIKLEKYLMKLITFLKTIQN